MGKRIRRGCEKLEHKHMYVPMHMRSCKSLYATRGDAQRRWAIWLTKNIARFPFLLELSNASLAMNFQPIDTSVGSAVILRKFENDSAKMGVM
ncbi:hypothetical protein POVWA2_057070 [Plasmodium ovale wallikeri]|uniref:Uncharacterized protein n=1 Tax=Plasmodium ovale wallikeri TaxID=864142 RepID=A0A1A8ZYH0_PLAOA|nr:hypothetical protein POVWA1_057720 [Plasmodium ovale wallikeri]SBT48931.1 hypothetical protein POVWA2_057070 [Plasmodium ovale wallikeri]